MVVIELRGEKRLRNGEEKKLFERSALIPRAVDSKSELVLICTDRSLLESELPVISDDTRNASPHPRNIDEHD